MTMRHERTAKIKAKIDKIVLVGVVTHRTALHVSEDLKHVHLPLCLAPVLVDVTAEG